MGIRNNIGVRTARIALLVAALCLPVVAAPSASAHKMSFDTARAAAKKKAREIKRQTGAYESRVTTCRRKSRHKIVCKVRSRYRSGLRTCITNVPVTYSSHRDRTPRAAIGPTVCS